MYIVTHRVNGNEVTQQEVEDVEKWMVDNDLGFVKSVGKVFSWSKKGSTANKIYSRIDHYIANPDWLLAKTQVVVQYLNCGISDHTPLLLDMIHIADGRGRPFNFFNHLTNHHQFLSIVSGEWGKESYGPGFSTMVRRLNAFKIKLKQLHKREFPEVQQKIGYWQSQVDGLQTELQLAPYDQTIMEQEHEAVVHWRKWMTVERKILTQKSRIHWLREGDENSQFFHASIKQILNINILNKLILEDGSILDTKELIHEEVLTFYLKLLGKQ